MLLYVYCSSSNGLLTHVFQGQEGKPGKFGERGKPGEKVCTVCQLSACSYLIGLRLTLSFNSLKPVSRFTIVLFCKESLMTACNCGQQT